MAKVIIILEDVDDDGKIKATFNFEPPIEKENATEAQYLANRIVKYMSNYGKILDVKSE